MAEGPEFDRLRKKRLEYVQSARENGFEEGLRGLLSELYPDNAHFVYELLQNAEDAKASRIDFECTETRLTVSHDGTRSFTIQDIEAITGIGNSTKKDDPTQIGKFGVGFKAVYAYTTRPEIRSGSYCFAIEDLFVPSALPGTAPKDQTTFAFPFDRQEKPPAQASAEVQASLKELGENTLLFLQSLREITYTLADGTTGSIKRHRVDEDIFRITSRRGDEESKSLWLLLTGSASIPTDPSSGLVVAAAFRVQEKKGRKAASNAPLDTGNEDATARRYRMSPLDRGDVCIYFPAVKESSGLRFHIHGPFASTVARDSIRDDPGNRQLIQDIADLIAGALPGMCAKGLVTTEFLASLPNEDDDVRPPYSRIFDAIQMAFNEASITPIYKSSEYSPAWDLVSSPPDFRELLEPSDLSTLMNLADIRFEAAPRWIRDPGGRAGTFLEGLESQDFGWSELRTVLMNARDVGDPDNEYVADWLAWLEGKSDEALLNFYQLIARASREGSGIRGSLPHVPLVRLIRRGVREHVKGSETHLPERPSDTNQSRVPAALAPFADDEDKVRLRDLQTFYEIAGVKPWDETAKIQTRLKKYQAKALTPIPDDGWEEHLADIEVFAEYALDNPTKAQRMFSEVALLRAQQSDGTWRSVTPRQVFLDIPFRETGLTALHPEVKLFWQGDSRQFAYDQPPYPLCGLYGNVDRVDDFMEIAGAKVGLEVARVPPWRNPLFQSEWRRPRENRNCIWSDWEIEGLTTIIACGDERLLKTLWMTVIETPGDRAKAVYRANGSTPRYEMDSMVAQTLKGKAWILDRDGELRRPSQITREDLRPDWPTPSGVSLLNSLDFEGESRGRAADRRQAESALKRLDVDPTWLDAISELQRLGMSPQDALASVRTREDVAVGLGGASLDPDRRASVAAADAAMAPEHAVAKRLRSVVRGGSEASRASRAYLKGQYTNDRTEMICQLCQKPMPFRTRDGTWYFEAIAFVGGRRFVHKCNALALCPLCAAMYRLVRDTDDDSLIRSMLAVTVDTAQESAKVPVTVNERSRTLLLTGKHAIDLRESLRKAGDERGRTRSRRSESSRPEDSQEEPANPEDLMTELL